MQTQSKVAVVHVDGTPLMPCSPARARKLVNSGAAVKRWTRTGVFYIQLTTPTNKHVQPLTMGIDPGANYDGICIASKEQMQVSGMLVVKNQIKDKMEQRGNMRRARRFRKTRRRPKRFDNRVREKGWLPPSIKARVDNRLRLIQSLLAIYPVSHFAVEDLRMDGNHLKGKTGREYYTWTMVAKAKLYDFLKQRGRLTLHDGEETARTREERKLVKTPRKGEPVFSSQAVDALALCALSTGVRSLAVTAFYAWRRPDVPRRQLHALQPGRGGVRRPYGGTLALGFRKNTVVEYRGGLYRTGGTTRGRLSLHSFDFENRRVTQKARPDECRELFRQSWFAAAANNNQGGEERRVLPRMNSGVSVP